MALPAVIAAIGRMGVSKAIKKYGKAAVDKARAAEKGVASKLGSKKGLDTVKGTSTMNRGRGYGLKQKGTGKMATKEQRAKNISSGRGRGLVAASTAMAIPTLGKGEIESPTTAIKRTMADMGGSGVRKKQAGPNPQGAPTKAQSDYAKQQTAKSAKRAEDARAKKAGSAKSASKGSAASSSAKTANKGGDWNQYSTIAQAKKAGSLYYSQNGKKMAAVYKEDLKPGESLRDYMNKKTGKTRKMMAGGMAKKYSKGKTVRGNGIAARSKTCKMR
jgi:hypothetical protein